MLIRRTDKVVSGHCWLTEIRRTDILGNWHSRWSNIRQNNMRWTVIRRIDMVLPNHNSSHHFFLPNSRFIKKSVFTVEYSLNKKMTFFMIRQITRQIQANSRALLLLTLPNRTQLSGPNTPGLIIQACLLCPGQAIR